jgi:transcriptional regulator with XRE-family HTH domain
MNFVSIYRKDKRLTQFDLAVKMNVSESLISKWERGRVMPTSEELIKLSEILEVSVRILFPESFGDKIK